MMDEDPEFKAFVEASESGKQAVQVCSYLIVVECLFRVIFDSF